MPKRDGTIAIEELKKKGIEKLGTDYNPLDISPKNGSLVERRDIAVEKSRENDPLNWERCSKSPGEEIVAQLFEKLLEDMKAKLQSDKKKVEEEDNEESEENDEDDNVN